MRLFKRLARSWNCVTLAMHQPLDLEHELDIAAAIQTLPRSALVRFQLRELRLPETQNIRFKFADLRDVANFEVEAVRDRRSFDGALSIQLCSHSKGESMRSDQRRLFSN